MPHQNFIGPDGKPWPSATELTNLLPADWVMSWYRSQVKKYGWRGWQRCKAQSNRGMKIGTMVHERLEHLVKKEPCVPYPQRYHIDELADKLFDTVNLLIEDYVAIEPHLVSHSYQVAGTADMIVRLHSRPGLWVGDYKTSYDKDELKHPLQLAIYATAWSETHPEQAIDQGFIARIDKKSKGLNVKIDEYQGLKQYIPWIKVLREIWEKMR